MTRARMQTQFGTAVLALGVVLTACTSSPKRYDVGRLESGLQQEIEARIGAPVASVRCQKNITVKPGTEFTCIATASSGAEATIRGTVTDAKGRFTWQLVSTKG